MVKQSKFEVLMTTCKACLSESNLTKGVNTLHLHELSNQLHAYIREYGLLGKVIDLDNVHATEEMKAIIKMYYKMIKRLNDLSIVANYQIKESVKLSYDNENGLESAKLNAKNANYDIRPLRKALITFAKNKGFSMLHDLMKYEHFRVMQGLYTDVLTFVRMSQNSKLTSGQDERVTLAIHAHFAYNDFKNSISRYIDINKLTELEIEYLSDLKVVPATNKLKKNLSSYRSQGKHELANKIQRHLEARLNAPKFERKVNNIKQKEFSVPQTKFDVNMMNTLINDMEQKAKKIPLESSFERKVTKKWHKRLVSVECEPWFIEMIEKNMIEEKQATNKQNAKFTKTLIERDNKLPGLVPKLIERQADLSYKGDTKTLNFRPVKYSELPEDTKIRMLLVNELMLKKDRLIDEGLRNHLEKLNY